MQKNLTLDGIPYVATLEFFDGCHALGRINCAHKQITLWAGEYNITDITPEEIEVGSDSVYKLSGDMYAYFSNGAHGGVLHDPNGHGVQHNKLMHHLVIEAHGYEVA